MLSKKMQLCAITNRKSLPSGSADAVGFFGGDAAVDQREQKEQTLCRLAAGWIAGGVDFIQLREKDLDAPALRRLAENILAAAGSHPSKLLVNLPAFPAGLDEIAPIADGVHLPGRPVRGAVELARRTLQAAGSRAFVSLSCHTLEDVRIAREAAADLILFAPVFGKALEESPLSGERRLGVSGLGLGQLARACAEAGEVPVFALGGVTAANAPSCTVAGAVGVAGIRLFLGEDWKTLQAPPCAGPSAS